MLTSLDFIENMTLEDLLTIIELCCFDLKFLLHLTNTGVTSGKEIAIFSKIADVSSTDWSDIWSIKLKWESVLPEF